MRPRTERIIPFLWFDTHAEEAVRHYTAIFPNSGIDRTTRYPAEGAQVSGMPEGSVMTVEFRLDGQPFVALNGGPHFKFTEAISFVVQCDSQEEIDHCWGRLSEGGDENAQQCGWLKDRYGVSWQIVPRELNDLLIDTDRGNPGRVWSAMLRMKKLDLAALRTAAETGSGL